MRALLCAPKLSNSPNGSLTLVRGLPRSSANASRLGTFSGTLRNPSMSSENEMRRVAIASSVRARKALRTMVVRATSLNVPICGNPDAPYPVSNTTGRTRAGRVVSRSSILPAPIRVAARSRSASSVSRTRISRASRLRACSKGQARASRAKRDKPVSIVERGRTLQPPGQRPRRGGGQPSAAIAIVTTASGVIPNASNSRSAGAEAPKVDIPQTSPVRL